jgi:hypothetical protein
MAVSSSWAVSFSVSGFARHGIDSPECRSIPAAQKNAPERVLVEVEASHCDWEHRSSLVDHLAFGA